MSHFPHMPHDHLSEYRREEYGRKQRQDICDKFKSKVVNDGGCAIYKVDRFFSGLSIKPSSYEFDLDSSRKYSVIISNISRSLFCGFDNDFYLVIYACPYDEMEGGYLLGFELDYWPLSGLKSGECYRDMKKSGVYKCPPNGYEYFRIAFAVCEGRSSNLMEYFMFDKRVNLY